jgi:DNA-binding XRE family transcriptional regulator
MAENRLTPRHLRLRAGWTQMQVAIKLGVSLSTVQAIEGRGQLPRLDLARKIAELFGTTMDHIEWGKAEPGRRGNPKTARRLDTDGPGGA